MNSRERVRAVLDGRIPDSVPRALYDVAIDSYNSSTLETFQARLGLHPRDAFRQDLRGLVMPSADGGDDWRKAVAAIDSEDDVHAVMDAWSRPVFDADGLAREVARIHRDGYPVIAVGRVSDFETPFHIRGREQFFMDLGYEEPWLPAFLDAITDCACAYARAAADSGADIFGIGDDLGSQRQMLISPDQWRRLFKPRLKRIIDAVKDTNPETAFFLHTDGNVMQIIADFVEIGVDILNPIQPEVMDPAEVKRLYGSDLVFFGAISVQHTLPLGTPEDVYNEVKLRMETIGAGGGYLMTPSHLINDDIPWENIVAFFEAAEKYGGYR